MARKIQMASKGDEKMESKEIATKRVLTQEKAEVSTYRLTPQDRQLMIAAALSLGESRSEFLRVAVRQRALKVLAGQDPLVRNQ